MKLLLRHKLILFLVAFLLFITLPLLGYSYFKYKNIIESYTHDYLVSLAEATEGQMFLFFDKSKLQAADWSSDGYIVQEFEEILKTGDQKKISQLREYFLSRKYTLSKNTQITDIFSLDGVAVFSTEEGRVGHSEEGEEMEKEYSFAKAKQAGFGTAFINAPQFEEDEAGHARNESMWHISVPLVSPRTGDIIGVMVNHISGKEVGDILSGKWQVEQGAESGQEFSFRFKTSEIYLVNKDRVMVTQSRFVEESILRLHVDTPPVVECLENTNEFSGLYKNYQGIDVYGASMCIKDSKFVLIVEVSEEEIFAEVRKGLKNLGILAGLLFLVGILGSILFSRIFLKNIDIVHHVATMVGQGNFDARANIVASDETGELARAFNSMLNTLDENKKKITIAEKEIREKARMLEQDVQHHEEQEAILADSRKVALNLLEDVSRTKENLEIEKYRLQTIISSVGDGLILIDGAYTVTLVNPRAVEMLAVPLLDLVGKDLRTVMKLLKKREEEIPPGRWPTEEMFLTKKIVRMGLDAGLFLTTKWRHVELPVTLSVAPLGGGLAGGVIIIRDVTADRELDDAKSGFISVASHQLRTPLTTIRWYSEMLLSEDAGVLSEAQKDFLKEIHGGAERLYQTIDLLLGISRIESGRIKQQKLPIDLVAFTDNVVHELAPSMTEKELIASVFPPQIEVSNIFLDPLMLRQVVMNLVSNAIRYTNKNGTIKISWSKSDDHREVMYSVSDNGIGIPEAQRGRIFTKFFRAENALTKVPDGSGLGLALVKELVESWKGRVWFETEEGKGTTFTFTVPLVTDVPLATDTSQPPAHGETA